MPELSAIEDPFRWRAALESYPNAKGSENPREDGTGALILMLSAPLEGLTVSLIIFS